MNTLWSRKREIIHHKILRESNTPRCKFSPRTYLISSNSSPSGQPQFPHNILKLVQIIIIELNIFWSRWDAPAILAQTKLWSRKGLVCIIGLEFYASWVLCVVNSVVNFIIKLWGRQACAIEISVGCCNSVFTAKRGRTYAYIKHRVWNFQDSQGSKW